MAGATAVQQLSVDDAWLDNLEPEYAEDPGGEPTICDDCARVLGRALARNASLTALSLAEIYISDVGTVAIARGIGGNPHLAHKLHLNLTSCHEYFDECAVAVLQEVAHPRSAVAVADETLLMRDEYGSEF